MNVKNSIAIRVFTTNLNKISESNKTIILRELTRTLSDINDEYEIFYQNLVDLLFSKSMNDHNFIHLYADVCFQITIHLFKTNKSQFNFFYCTLINRYQAFFEDTDISHSPVLPRNISFSSMTELSANSSIPSTADTDKKVRCTIFIALLICKKFIDEKTVKLLITELYEKKKYEPICILVKHTHHSENCKSIYKDENISTIITTMYENRHAVSARIRFLIEDVYERLFP